MADAADTMLIDLATMGLPAHRHLRELLTEIWSDGPRTELDAPAAPAMGLLSLRAAVAAHLTERGLDTTVEQVLITAGESHAFSLVARSLLGRRDCVVVENPTSPQFLDVLRPLPVTVCAARPVTDGHDNLVRMVERRAPRLVHVMPTLGPRGSVLDHELRCRLAWAVAGRDAVVVDDVSQATLTFESSPPPLAAHADSPNLVTVGSLSALHWGGMRVGWVRATPMLVDRFAASTVDVPVPVLDQILAERLLMAQDAIRAERIGWLRGRLEHAVAVLSARLPEFSWQPPAGGLTVWLECPAGTRPGLAELLVRHGVALRPGTSFAVRPTSESFSLVYARSSEVVEEGVRRVAAAWRRHSRRR